MSLRNDINEIKRRAYLLDSLEAEIQLSHTEWLHRYASRLNWKYPHLAHIIDRLEQVTSGEIKKLMLFLPPRHGKSELVTKNYASWRISSNPETRIIIAAYNLDLAARFSRLCRRLVQESIPLSDERTAVVDWETAVGGGVRAAGVGSGVTGVGANLIIIDDPVKSREEVRSLAYRERTWEWYSNDVYTRLEPNGSIILIMTRWHDDDLAGRILSSADAENWVVVSLPAEAEENDPLGRKFGEPLWPERYDKEALEEIQMVLGINYSALYQQRPLPRQGGMFQIHWFEIVPSGPTRANRTRYWDKASSAGTGSYTCGVLLAKRQDGIIFIEDVIRGQWSAGEREAIIEQTAVLDRQNNGRVSIVLEQEPGGSGKESAEASIRNLSGFIVKADRVTGNKIIRAEPFAAQAEAGNVKLVRGAWNSTYLDELTSFPYGKYSDQVDASSGAFNNPVSNYGDYLRQAVKKPISQDNDDIRTRFDRAIIQQLLDDDDSDRQTSTGWEY